MAIRMNAADDDPAGRLCAAAAKGDINQLRDLIEESGLDANTGDYDRRTALHLAASEGLLEVVTYLVAEANTDPSPVDRWGGTPLDDAMRSHHQDVIVFLTSKGAKAGKTATTTGIENASTELCDAASKGDMERLKQLVTVLGVDVNVGDYDKRTAIHLAASEGLLPVVRVLVGELGANHSPEDRWGGTPLNDATRHGHSEVMTYLKSVGAVLGSMAQEDPATELCNAAHKADLRRLRFLVHKKRYNVNHGDYDKRTAIHLAASEGLLEVVTCLVTELRADSSPVDRWGNTPLDDGIRAGHTSVIKFLRANGAKNGTGASGAMPTRRVSAADLCDAAFSDDVARLRDFVTEGANVNQGDYDRRTALHIAASEGNLEVVMYLINEAGADPSPVDRWGGTPLDDAIRSAASQKTSDASPRAEARSQYLEVRRFLESKGAKGGSTSNQKKKSSACVLL